MMTNFVSESSFTADDDDDAFIRFLSTSSTSDDLNNTVSIRFVVFTGSKLAQ